MNETGKVDRRTFLKISGAVLGASVLCCSGTVLVGTQTRVDDFVNLYSIEESKNVKKVLVAYGSKCGSTGEVAEAIAKVFTEKGAAVDVLRVQDISNIDQYDAVVLGSAARMGKLLPEAVSFAEKHAEILQRTPTAYFTTGITMVHDTPENRTQAEGYLDPLCAIQTPLAKGLFAGKVERSKMELLWKLALSFDKEGEMRDADYRDWEKIGAWAADTASKML